ncbi:MAG: hypothetical protein HOP11_12455 [Saprospiraceae bacterium]|nr:hypothetical protein [Saprospiraceae bacterium]
MEKNKTRFFILLIAIITISLELFSQASDTLIGSVSYQNTNNVYVKFKNTNKLSINDTLLRFENDYTIPCLIIQQLSSQSAVCVKYNTCKISTNDNFYFILKSNQPILNEPTIGSQDTFTKSNLDSVFNPSRPVTLIGTKKNARKENFNLRLLTSATGSFNNSLNDGTHRTRTSASLNYENINNSHWSIHSFINYNYRFGKVYNANNLKSDLKIYGLDLEFKIDSTQIISAGRKINNNISNVGAIDGLQYEKRINKFVLGAAVGSRPDLTTYHYNFKLPLYGVYASFKDKNNTFQNTIGVFEIRSHGKTDRRFAYIQHNHTTMIKNLYLFGSAEFDLYKVKDSVVSNSPTLTSFFINARYKVNRKLSFSASYDNRKNVIFFESYKNNLDQLLDEETRTGIRLQTTFQIWKYLNTSASFFYRYQGKQNNPTRNLSVYLGSNRIPVLKMSASASYNFIETIYFTGQTKSFRTNKDLFKSKTNLELEYRIIKYKYLSSELNLPKNIVALSISQIISKNTTLLLSGEIDSEPKNQSQRYFVTLIRRFRHK